MAALIERLRLGKFRYRGAERTFGVRLSYGVIVTVERVEQLLVECQRLLSEHPDWVGDARISRVFLVHTPEEGYSLDDEQSPYFLIRGLRRMEASVGDVMWKVAQVSFTCLLLVTTHIVRPSAPPRCWR